MCAKNHKGVLCLECNDGLVYFGDTCIECSDMGQGKSFLSRGSFWVFLFAPAFLMIACSLFPRPEVYLVKRSSALFNIVVEIAQLLIITISPYSVILDRGQHKNATIADISNSNNEASDPKTDSTSGDIVSALFEAFGFKCPFEYSPVVGMYAALQLCIIALFGCVAFTFSLDGSRGINPATICCPKSTTNASVEGGERCLLYSRLLCKPVSVAQIA